MPGVQLLLPHLHRRAILFPTHRNRQTFNKFHNALIHSHSERLTTTTLMSLKISTISSNQKYAIWSWSARIGSTKVCIVTRKYKTTYESSTESSEPWSSLLAKPKGSWLHTNSQIIILILVRIDSIINKGPAHTRKIQWEDHKWVNFPSHCCPSQQCAPVECQAQECLWLPYPHPAIHHVQSRNYSYSYSANGFAT